MSCWLRQSTAVEIAIGPFLDSTDGNTVESGLTITQPDIRLKKDGAAWAQKNAAQTLSHEENGWYEISLDTTDTNTLGQLIVAVHESGALPVWREFMIVPTQVYDSFFSTDLLQVDVITIANNAITEASIAPDAVREIRSLVFGTADSGSTTTMVDAARTESTTDYWKGCLILFSQINQCRLITGFNPSTDTITFAPATTQAISTHEYEILPAARVDLQLWQGTAPNALTSGRVEALLGAAATGVIDAAAMAADMNTYTTRTWVGREGTTTDKYIVQWAKNGQVIASGITVPLIRVYKASDGTDLIAETAMTEIGSTQSFKFFESTNKLTPGEIYMVEAKATIDGSVRMDRQPVMRDSA